MYSSLKLLAAVALFPALLLAVPKIAEAQHGHGGHGSSGGGHAVAQGRHGVVQHGGRGLVIRSGGRTISHGVRRHFRHDALRPRHGLHVGLGPLGYYYGRYSSPWSARYPYYASRYSAATVRRSATVATPSDQFRGPGVSDDDSLVVERVSASIVRVTWLPGRQSVSEVGIFLADSAETVLAVQTLRAPPYAAVFEATSAAAFAGVTVVERDGSPATALVPLGADGPP